MVVSAARQELGNFAPLVAVLFVRLDDLAVLLGRPLVLLDVGVQVVVPALAALLTNASRKSLSDVGPVLGAVLVHVLGQLGVLLSTPGSFHHGRVEHLLPSMQALNVRSLVQEGRDLLPVLGAELLHQLRQPFIFLVVPVALVVVRV